MVCDTAVYERHHGSGILARQELSDRETRLHIAVWKKAVVDEREVDFRFYLAESLLVFGGKEVPDFRLLNQAYAWRTQGIGLAERDVAVGGWHLYAVDYAEELVAVVVDIHLHLRFRHR